MKTRDVIRLVIWGLLFVICLSLGLYGYLLSQNKIEYNTNYNVIETL